MVKFKFPKNILQVKYSYRDKLRTTQQLSRMANVFMFLIHKERVTRLPNHAEWQRRVERNIRNIFQEQHAKIYTNFSIRHQNSQYVVCEPEYQQALSDRLESYLVAEKLVSSS